MTKLINQLHHQCKVEDVSKYSHEELAKLCADMANTLWDLIIDYNETKLRLQYIEHAAFTAKQRTDYMLSGKEK